MTTATPKTAIRENVLARRDGLSATVRQDFSQQIARYGNDAINFAPHTIISGFLPIRSEVDLQPLMALLRKKGARLCLPVVLDRQTICFREWEDGVELINTGFGTRGPGPEAAVLDPDILLVPLSAFDGKGNRIGYGAGHYDRAIARLHQKGCNPTLIGIAFDCQEVADVPFEPHDVALHAILTESGYKNFKT